MNKIVMMNFRFFTISNPQLLGIVSCCARVFHIHSVKEDFIRRLRWLKRQRGYKGVDRIIKGLIWI